jgi:hypothetical protein
MNPSCPATYVGDGDVHAETVRGRPRTACGLGYRGSETSGDTRYYRAVEFTSLNRNLFSLLPDQVVKPATEDMAFR